MESIWAKVGRIAYGACRDDVQRMYFEDRNLDTMHCIKDAGHKDLALERGWLKEQCAAL